MKRNESGLTLVELLITIVVIGVVFESITSLFLSIQNAQVKAAYLESATRAAQREIEVLRNNSYNSLTAGQSINFTSSLPDTLPQNRTGTVAVTEPLAGLKRVDVTVSYTHSGKTYNVKLSSTIGIIGIAR